jgi:hypothetical protein
MKATAINRIIMTPIHTMGLSGAYLGIAGRAEAARATIVVAIAAEPKNELPNCLGHIRVSFTDRVRDG